jgi:hypothetical protein
MKFVLTADIGTPNMENILREIYVLFTDCALKDPFYELDMPIKCDLFLEAIDTLVDRAEKRFR